MALGREALYSKLYLQLSELLLAPLGPFAYIGRRPVPIGKLGAEQYPALSLVEMGEDYARGTLYVPAKVTLTVGALIQSEDGAAGDEFNVATLNNLADAVEDALQSWATQTAQNTLDGLVQQCWIEGRQVVITGSYPQRWSEQVMSIKIVLPHSR